MTNTEQFEPEAAEEDVLEGEQLPGVSKEPLTKEEAQEAFHAFLALPEMAAIKDQVSWSDPIVIEGQREEYPYTEAQLKADQEARAKMMAQSARDADLVVAEGLDEPISTAATLDTLHNLLVSAQKAVAVLIKAEGARQSPPELPDTSDEL